MNQTTAIAPRDDTARVPAPKPQIVAGGAVAALVPQTLEEAFRIANALSQSGDMIPKGYQGKPEMIMAAMMKGAEVGFPPMQALAAIAVVNGRPTIYGDGVTALVLRAGHALDCVIEGEGEKAVAVATLTRGNGQKIIREFSVSDAKKAGLWGKAGPWSQYPMRMLSWRAKNWAARDGAADALMGLMIHEEAQDIGPDHARDVTPAQHSRRGRVSYASVQPDPIPDQVDGGHDPATGELFDALSDEDAARIQAEALAASNAAAAMED